MKIRPVEAELFHANGQTDRHDEVNIRKVTTTFVTYIRPKNLGK